MRFSRYLYRTVLVIVMIAGVTSFAGVVFVRSAYPTISGERRVRGAREAVDVVRDEHGVVHIRSANKHDLYFAQGYAHAQDRLWQMELQRRAAAGRTAELFGEDFVSTDAFLRRMGIPRVAERVVETASPDATEMIDAYIAGVNAFLESGRRPFELRLLGVHPEPWSRRDVGGIVALMGFDLGMNWEVEATRLAMVDTVGFDAVAETLPPFDYAGPATWTAQSGGVIDDVDDGAAAVRPGRTGAAGGGEPDHTARKRALTSTELAGLRVSRQLRMLGALPRTGSNSWLISGERTAEGVPLLANDPHLELGLPSLWYEMELEYGDHHWVRGFTIPGAPSVVVGHNRDVAWGLTNTADTQDLFLERRHAEESHRFERDGEWYSADVETSEIVVAGQDDTVPIEIVHTANGPLISENPDLSLYWSAYDIERSPFDAFRAMNTAESVYDFRDALIDFEVPVQNLVFADRHGNIAFRTAGRIPARTDYDGVLPRAGWDPDDAVPDPIPFDELPEIINPDDGFIATANHRVADDPYPYRILPDSAPPSRMERIVERVGESESFSAADSRSLQNDWANLHARRWLPRFLDALGPPEDYSGLQREAIEILDEWASNLVYELEKTAPVIFAHWYLVAMRMTFEPALGDDLYLEFLDTAYLAYNSFDAVLGRDESRWTDGPIEPVLSAAFFAAVTDLEQQLGSDIRSWKWQEIQQIELTHAMGDIWPLSLLVNRGPYPYGGDHMTVGRAAYDLVDPFNVNLGAGIRMVVSLEASPVSWIAHAGGQSGHPGNRWYADQFEAWRRGEYRQVTAISGREPNDPQVSRLRLLPDAD